MTASRRVSATAASAVLILLLSLGAARVHAAGEQVEQFTPEFRQIHTSFDQKHTPKIVAPESVKRGEWFTVTVSVGAGGQHPSLYEHFVRYIALYKDTVEIARDEGGLLRAVEEPTHSAAWEASKKIEVLP